MKDEFTDYCFKEEPNVNFGRESGELGSYNSYVLGVVSSVGLKEALKRGYITKKLCIKYKKDLEYIASTGFSFTRDVHFNSVEMYNIGMILGVGMLECLKAKIVTGKDIECITRLMSCISISVPNAFGGDYADTDSEKSNDEDISLKDNTEDLSKGNEVGLDKDVVYEAIKNFVKDLFEDDNEDTQQLENDEDEEFSEEDEDEYEEYVEDVFDDTNDVINDKFYEDTPTEDIKFNVELPKGKITYLKDKEKNNEDEK